MSYFDHVRCPNCRSMLDPEQLGGRSGFGCPHCGKQLSAASLFGLSAAFSEEETPDLTLEDLMKPDGGLGDPGETSGLPFAARQAAGPPSESTEIVRAEDEGEGEGGGSAMDLMRKMKKR